MEYVWWYWLLDISRPDICWRHCSDFCQRYNFPRCVTSQCAGQPNSQWIVASEYDDSARTVTVAGNVTIAGSFTVVDAGAATNHSLNVGGNFTNNGTFDGSTGNHTINVTLNGTAAQTIGGSGVGTFDYYDLTIANTAATVSATRNFNVVGTMTVNTNATFSPAATVQINSSGGQGTITGSGTIYVSRIVAVNALDGQYNFTAKTLTTLTVDFSAAGNQQIDALTYGPLRTSGSGTKTLAGAVTVGGDLTVGSGTTLATGNSPVTLNGNFTNNGTFTAGSSQINIGGTGTQSIAGFTTTGLVPADEDGRHGNLRRQCEWRCADHQWHRWNA